jgi:hypothetical protein
MSGFIYTVDIAIRRTAKSCASIEDFSTYHPQSDAYNWKECNEAVFAVVPSVRKQNIILVTLYIQVPQNQGHAKLRSIARKIFQQEFFPNVCGTKIQKIGKPQLFFEPMYPQSKNLDDAVVFPSRILDLITHIEPT